MCIALNDHTQKAGLVFFSSLEKGCELIRENLENTKGQKSRIGITEKTILQRLLLCIWASFRSLGWEVPLEEEMATHSSCGRRQRSLLGYNPCGSKESDMTEQITLPSIYLVVQFLSRA